MFKNPNTINKYQNCKVGHRNPNLNSKSHSCV